MYYVGQIFGHVSHFGLPFAAIMASAAQRDGSSGCRTPPPSQDREASTEAAEKLTPWHIKSSAIADAAAVRNAVVAINDDVNEDYHCYIVKLMVIAMMHVMKRHLATPAT
jgi:hypothetical protein